MQTLKLVVLFLGISFSSFSQKSTSGKVNWVTLDEAETLIRKEKKPLLIDLYTDWCGWCKVMDKKTYNNKQVGMYMDDRFYAVKINAEDRQPIVWNGKKYTFNEAYRTNDFALFLTDGKLSYPTTVIIPADGSAPQAIPGFLAPRDFEPIVKYFGEDKYGKIGYEEFHNNFKSSW